MTIDSYSEPLRLDLKASGSELDASILHKESEAERGWLKELLGKLTVGGAVTFKEPQVALDETFSLNGAEDALEPCLKAKYVAQQAQNEPQEQQPQK